MTIKCVTCGAKTYRGNTCQTHYDEIMSKQTVINEPMRVKAQYYAITLTEQDDINNDLAQTWQRDNLDY